MKRVLILIALLAMAQGALAEEKAEEKSVIQKTGEAVKKGGEAAGHGIEKGIDATGKGLKKGAKATGRGLEKAGKWIEKKVHKDGDKSGKEK